MIPKIIHYCWFGGKPLPKLAVKCKKSWEEFFPDYEIREWNEQNFDVNQNEYTRFCYEHQLWAYLSDYARLAIIEEEGGLYFDTDVEVLRCPVELLNHCHAWFGWETEEFLNTGLGFASEAHHPVVLAMKEMYEKMTKEELQERYIRTGNLTGCPRINTWALLPLGLRQDGTSQEVSGAKILPQEYLCPLDDLTGKKTITRNTISIHWFSKSPHGKKAWFKNKLARPLHRFIQYLKRQK